MTAARCCSRAGCGRTAIATLTYVYDEQTAVLGPLAVLAEPHCYDLCATHADRLSAPRGWEVLRLTTDRDDGAEDDLEALANAVREGGHWPVETPPPKPGGRRPRLRVLHPPD